MRRLPAFCLLMLGSILALAPAASAATQDALVPDANGSTVARLDLDAGVVVATIPVGNSPYHLAITPGGETAYVVNRDDDNVSVIDMATSTVIATIPVGSTPFGVAITPSGARVYVANYFSNSVSVIDTANNTVIDTILLPGNAYQVAITPDGTKAYVTDGVGSVFVIDVATATLVTTIVTPGPASNGIAVTPDGQAVYVGLGTSVVSIDTANNTIAATIPVPGTFGGDSDPLAITPDGAKAYAANYNQGQLAAIETATNSLLAPIDVNPFAPTGIAFAPDGQTGYAPVNGGAGVETFDTATDALGVPIALGFNNAGDIAITPDQAPTAAFSVTAGVAGSASSFGALASSSPLGSIAEYAWDFGDGATVTTASPTISHTYASGGNYTATLTVTNTAGTSTTQVFTGQTMSRNGGPSAVASHNVTISAAPTPAPSPAAAPQITNLKMIKDCTRAVQLTNPKRGSAGLSISYDLNLDATVTYTFKQSDQSAPKKLCPKRRGRTEVTYKEIQQLTGPGAAGNNNVEFSRTRRSKRAIKRKRAIKAGRHKVSLSALAAAAKLAPGTYLVMVQATDSQGQKSNSAFAKFWVVSGR